ncbi:glycosyltransferase [Parafannyhessea umbonata]|uniref:glycosyltransferase n=1 Tax=Parafannyhessea umbonata TaxID=604330 RepID=UPI0026F36741|nr:glycosyltransferase [Parafannyhessea umbonata]MDD6602021.1 glycosyltransferase [Parafannyhessea umbonata]
MLEDASSKVSVIVPIYNAGKFLRQCLDSICNQTHRELEIILIDDGCTDGSPAVIDEYAARDPRVRAVHKENGGYGAGCNRGLQMATGKWVSIVEPDDYLELTMYQDMLDFAATFEDQMDIVKCPWTEVARWDDPARTSTRPCQLASRMVTCEKPFTISDRPMLIATHPSIWSAIYRMDFINEKGIRFIEYPGAGWADNPFLIETMCQASSIVYLNKCYYNYRIDLPDSTRNHKTPDLVTRPFDRWVTMLDVIRRLGITDRKVLAAHYDRGFTYAYGAEYDDGKDNPLVVEGEKRIFGMMDPAIVEHMCELPLNRLRRYCELMGRPMPAHAGLARGAYLLGSTKSTVDAFGLGKVVSMVARHGLITVTDKIKH